MPIEIRDLQLTPSTLADTGSATPAPTSHASPTPDSDVRRTVRRLLLEAQNRNERMRAD